MNYNCLCCERTFAFPEKIAFCPFCGIKFDAAPSAAPPNAVAEAMDAIWGAAAQRKSEFTAKIRLCAAGINALSFKGMADILPKQSQKPFDEFYAAVKRCNTRAKLLTYVDNYLAAVDKSITELDDTVHTALAADANAALSKTRELCGELGEIIGAEVSLDAKDFTAEDFTLRCTQSEYRTLYEKVAAAHEKYARCVKENNMFAAFSSDSDYGKAIYAHYFGEAAKTENDTQEPPKLSDVIEDLDRANALPYKAMLDEDFAPHVDAFWYGLETLCRLLEARIVMDIDASRFTITDAAVRDLLRRMPKEIVPSGDVLAELEAFLARISDSLKES